MHKEQTTPNIAAGLGIGAIVSLGIMLLGSLLIAWLTVTERLPQDKMGYGVMIVTAIAAAAGSTMTIRWVKHFALVMSVCSGFLYFIILLSINAVFFGGQYQGIGETLLLVLGSGVSVALIGNINKNKSNSHRRKRRNG